MYICCTVFDVQVWYMLVYDICTFVHRVILMHGMCTCVCVCVKPDEDVLLRLSTLYLALVISVMFLSQ